MNYNFCTAVGIIESFDSEIQMGVKIPLAEVSIFSKETDSWNLSIYVAIVEDADQKKAQGLSRGDIVFFTGKPTVIDGHNVVFSNSFIILKKNKLDLPIGLCKISYLEYLRLDNVAAVAGRVCAVNGSVLSLMIKKDGYYMRGEIINNDYVKVQATNTVDVNEGDFIICIGQLSSVGVKGMVAVIENGHKKIGDNDTSF